MLKRIYQHFFLIATIVLGVLGFIFLHRLTGGSPKVSDIAALIVCTALFGMSAVVGFMEGLEQKLDNWRLAPATSRKHKCLMQGSAQCDCGESLASAHWAMSTITRAQSTGETADQAAKASAGPRVTPADIEANIASEHYFTASDGVVGATAALTGQALGGITYEIPPLHLLTFCVLVLRNGFTATGTSACASPENFDAEIGRKVARQKALEDVWMVMGYELRTKLAGGAAA